MNLREEITKGIIMETEGPISFHRGTRDIFIPNKHTRRCFPSDACHQLYRNLYSTIQQQYWNFRAEYFCNPISCIVDHLEKASVPSAANPVTLVAGLFSDIDLTNRDAFFNALLLEERLDGFYIARMRSADPPVNVETALECVIEQVLDDSDSDCSGLPFQTLQRHWQENSGKERKEGILIILENVATFSSQVLEDLLLVLSQYKDFGLPIVVIAGFPHSRSASDILPHCVLRKYVLQPVPISMKDVNVATVNYLSSMNDSSFHLPPKSCQLLSSSVVEGTLPCGDLMHVLKLILLEHFRVLETDDDCKLIGQTREGEATERVERRQKETDGMETRRKAGKELERASVPNGSSPNCTPRGRKRRKTLFNEQSSKDEWRKNYDIGQAVLVELLLSASEDSPDILRRPSAYFEYDQASSTVLRSYLSSLDDDELNEVITYCEDTLEEDGEPAPDGESDIIVQFRHDLGKLKHAEALEASATPKKSPARTRSTIPANPNHSSKVAHLLKMIDEKKSLSKSTEGSILKMKRKRLYELLDDFIKRTVVPPPISIPSPDIIFLEQLLAPSSRKFLVSDLSNPDFSAHFDIYEEAYQKIDLSKWFEKFSQGERPRSRKAVKVEDAGIAARFYRFLSSLEYIGLIEMGREMNFVNKLFWNMATIK